MSTPNLIPVISPEGVEGTIPAEQLQAATQRQFKVKVTSPEGQPGYVPIESLAQARQRGFELAGPKTPEKEGFWKALGSDLVGIAKAIPQMGNPVLQTKNLYDLATNAKSDWEARKAAGHGTAYNTAALANEALGVNAKGMEQAAEAGDTGGVLGHAAAVPVTIAATEGALRVAPKGIAALRAAPEAVKTGTLAAIDKGATLAEKTPIIGKDIAEVREGLRSPDNMPPEDLAMRATKPRNSIVNAKQKISEALPDARRAADKLGIDPSTMTLEDAEKAVTQAKNDIWGEFENRFLKPNEKLQVPADSVADAIEGVSKNMTDIQKRRLGGAVDKIAEAAADYRGQQMPLRDVNLRIQELNNELRSQQAQFKVNEAALRKDPAYAPRFAELDALRQLEANSLEALSGDVGVSDLKRRYGSQKMLEDVLQRRINVAERQNPVSLPQAMGRIHGVGKVAKGIATGSAGDVIEGLVNLKAGENARMYNDPDYLIQQAFSKTSPRSAPMPRRGVPIKGQLPAGPIITPPPADVSGTPLEPEYLPPPPAPGTRATRLGLLLPERTGGIPLPAVQPESVSGLRSANSVVVRDLRTGRMRRMYVTSGK